MQSIQPVNRNAADRSGKALVLLAICLPAVFAVIGVTMNSATLQDHRLDLQHAADAAATAAALELRQVNGNVDAVAREILRQNHVPKTATIAINTPPTSGVFSGSQRHVEVVVQQSRNLFLGGWLLGEEATVRVRAVAGVRNATSAVAVQILDPDPEPFSVLGLAGVLPALPTLLGGLEVEGVGSLTVHGAVVSNNKWGGLDESGCEVGFLPRLPGLQHSISCTPVLPITCLRADDIYVAGGVDMLGYYGYRSGQAGRPVLANRRQVVDPFQDLPVPTTANDSHNVSAQYRGSENILSLPILLPRIRLRPGVYEYINIISGRVLFEPGVYIIRGVNPLTGISLQVLSGDVEAEGVMFYITNSGGYQVGTGSPDAADGETPPVAPGLGTILPSVVINAGLLNCTYTGLQDPTSPFHGMLIYQRRQDRRLILILKENLLGNANVQGTIYAKWGHVILSGRGTFRTALVAGTARVLTVAGVTIQPSHPLPAVEEVALME